MNLGGVALAIRNHRLVVPVMDYGAHVELHKATARLVRRWKAKLITPVVLDVVNQQTSTLGAVDALLSYFDKKSQESITPVSIRCEAERMGNFIELQRPFLEYGIIDVE